MKNYSIEKSISILERTPVVLENLLPGLDDEFVLMNEGGETWSPFDVMGHLIHGEYTDWIARLEIVLSDKGDKKFTPFDRFAQFRESKGKSMNDLIGEFRILREKNIAILKSKKLSDRDFDRTGIHPDFGTVTLKNLIATWAVHDMNHIGQIVRVMAFQLKQEVGPWKKYMRILSSSG